MCDSIVQVLRDVGAADNFNTILALWARSLLWQQQQKHNRVSETLAESSAALRSARRLLHLARPSDDDIVFMWVLPIMMMMMMIFACGDGGGDGFDYEQDQNNSDLTSVVIYSRLLARVTCLSGVRPCCVWVIGPGSSSIRHR